MKKKGFLFFSSIYDAIETLSKKNKLIAYEAIMRYAIKREEPENLPKQVLSIFLMVKPLLDSNAEKYEKSLEKKKQSFKFSSSKYEKVQLPEKKNEANDSFDNDNSDWV